MSGSWDPSVRVSSSQALSMAEPMHRIPPGGVTSGQSLRDVPKSCVQEVKEICLYYVQKVSGQYSNNKTAARYVHQMAEEIILQLAGVAGEIKKNRGEPEMFKSLLEEWTEHFPPSLGSIGSPKAIAALVASQTREITKLKSDLESERLHRDSDVSGILRSMDAQLHAYRNSVITDRRQHKLMSEAQLSEKMEEMAVMTRRYSESLQTLQLTHAQEKHALQESHITAMERLKNEKENEKSKFVKRFEGFKMLYHEKYSKLQEKYLELKFVYGETRSKYHLLARQVDANAELSDSDEDSFSVFSEDEGDDEEGEEGEDNEEGRKKSKVSEEALLEFRLDDDGEDGEEGGELVGRRGGRGRGKGGDSDNSSIDSNEEIIKIADGNDYHAPVSNNRSNITSSSNININNINADATLSSAPFSPLVAAAGAGGPVGAVTGANGDSFTPKSVLKKTSQLTFTLDNNNNADDNNNTNNALRSSPSLGSMPSMKSSRSMRSMRSQRSFASTTGNHAIDEMMVKSLKEKLHTLSNEKKRLEQLLVNSEGNVSYVKTSLDTMKGEVENLLIERTIYLQRNSELERMNDSLRKALALGRNGEEKENVKQQVSSEVILCHTPHFLDKPDRKGMVKDKKKISGYVVAGRF